MGDIEQSCPLADSHMLGNNALTEMEGEFPSSEIREFHTVITFIDLKQWSPSHFNTPSPEYRRQPSSSLEEGRLYDVV
jgi:hypothetical protein